MTKFKRPLPKEYENVNMKDHFELRYLRWDYFVRAENPTESELLKHERTIKFIARKMYDKYRYDFSFHGVLLEDVENVARCHTVSFLGLYSFKNKPEKKEAYSKESEAKYGIAPNEEIFLKKESCNLMNFLQHRLEDFAHYTRNKYQESPGFSHQKLYVQIVPGQWPSDEELCRSPSEFGWASVSRKQYQSLGKAVLGLVPGTSLVVNDKTYRVAAPQNEWVDLYGFAQIDPGSLTVDNGYTHKNYTPSAEELMVRAEDEGLKIRTINGISTELTRRDRIGRIVEKYNKLDINKKKRLISKLIHVLSKNKDTENLAVAKRLLGSLKKAAERSINGN